tara:strand:+ start:602 stop:802 length:201 start_codon:yes stop_codon:yes gene_type:complete
MKTQDQAIAISHILINTFKSGIGTLENIVWAMNEAYTSLESSIGFKVGEKEKNTVLQKLVVGFSVN